MKKTITMVAGFVLLLLSASVNAQEPKTWDPKKNPTVDSITSQYSAKMIPARPALTTDQIFPVLGLYESSVNADATSVSVTLDEQNKGLVWIDGLPQGRVKAMLRKSPSTYKIPAQKTAEGKDVSEGTLIFEKEANTLNIVIGKPYNSEDPSAVFVTTTEEPVVTEVKTKGSKTKVKIQKVKAWTYTGTKVEVETATTVISNQ